VPVTLRDEQSDVVVFQSRLSVCVKSKRCRRGSMTHASGFIISARGRSCMQMEDLFRRKRPSRLRNTELLSLRERREDGKEARAFRVCVFQRRKAAGNFTSLCAHGVPEVRRKCQVKGRTMRETKSRLDANRKRTRRLGADDYSAGISRGRTADFSSRRVQEDSRKKRGKKAEGKEDDSCKQ